jgi:hypothetical protein
VHVANKSRRLIMIGLPFVQNSVQLASKHLVVDFAVVTPHHTLQVTLAAAVQIAPLLNPVKHFALLINVLLLCLKVRLY